MVFVSQNKSTLRAACDRIPSKRRGRLAAAALIACVLVTVQAGCSREKTYVESHLIFASLMKEATGIYSQLHPLRSSRLGISSSDSLLFTFSEAEIRQYSYTIDTLLAEISSLPASHFSRQDRERSQTVISWLRGELFSMRKLRNHSTNPLLYCWLLEEALYSIPSRPGKARSGELEAYAGRLRHIPALIDNAKRNLDDPATLHVTLAAERLDILLEGMAPLGELLRLRYGAIPRSFDVAAEKIGDFAEFIKTDLSGHTHGRFILGTENLSDIVRFSEQLDIDLEEISQEAQKSVNKYRSQLQSIGRNDRIAPDTDLPVPYVDLPGIMIDIEEKIRADRVPGDDRDYGSVPPPDVILAATPPLQRYLPVNPYMVVPMRSPRGIVSVNSTTFDGSECGRTIIISPGEERGGKALLYSDLLSATSATSEAETALCEENDSLGTIFASELFMLSWETLNRRDIGSLFPELKMALRKVDLEKKLAALSRLTVVISLHTGAFTIDSAIAYMIQSLGIPYEEAVREVYKAAASPSAAYPGLAVIFEERLVKASSSVRGERRPRQRTRKTMLDNAGMPVSVVLEHIDR